MINKALTIIGRVVVLGLALSNVIPHKQSHCAKKVKDINNVASNRISLIQFNAIGFNQTTAFVIEFFLP